jgi:hypothetical protein
MAKLPKEEVEKIIKKSMKGYKVREEKPTDNPVNRVKPDAGGLDLDALRKKFLRTDYIEEEPPTDAAAPEDEIVIVEPEGRAPLDRGARGKAVVVSGKKKKIIGQQG